MQVTLLVIGRISVSSAYTRANKVKPLIESEEAIGDRHLDKSMAIESKTRKFCRISGLCSRRSTWITRSEQEPKTYTSSIEPRVTSVWVRERMQQTLVIRTRVRRTGRRFVSEKSRRGRGWWLGFIQHRPEQLLYDIGWKSSILYWGNTNFLGLDTILGKKAIYCIGLNTNSLEHDTILGIPVRFRPNTHRIDRIWLDPGKKCVYKFRRRIFVDIECLIPCMYFWAFFDTIKTHLKIVN